MAAYFIANQLEVTDPDTMAKYREGTGPTVAQYGGKMIVRGGAAELLEGEWPEGRMIVMVFDDMAALKAWYDSLEYSDLKAMRQSASKSNIMAVEGI